MLLNFASLKLWSLATKITSGDTSPGILALMPAFVIFSTTHEMSAPSTGQTMLHSNTT